MTSPESRVADMPLRELVAAGSGEPSKGVMRGLDHNGVYLLDPNQRKVYLAPLAGVLLDVAKAARYSLECPAWSWHDACNDLRAALLALDTLHDPSPAPSLKPDQETV